MPWCCLTITIMTATSTTLMILSQYFFLFTLLFLFCSPCCYFIHSILFFDYCYRILFVRHLINDFAAQKCRFASNQRRWAIKWYLCIHSFKLLMLILYDEKKNVDSWKSGCRVDKTWLLKWNEWKWKKKWTWSNILVYLSVYCFIKLYNSIQICKMLNARVLTYQQFWKHLE